jgi:spore maturation protein CgeB
VVYNNIEDLDNKLRYYMENDDEARIIAEEAWKHMARHHTTKVRGEEFISLCKRYL